jgi:hypothetical protein
MTDRILALALALSAVLPVVMAIAQLGGAL